MNNPQLSKRNFMRLGLGALAGFSLTACDREKAPAVVKPAATPVAKLQAGDFPADTTFKPDNTSVNIVAKGAGLMKYVSGSALSKADQLDVDNKICFAVLFRKEAPERAVLVKDSLVRFGPDDRLIVFKDITGFLEKCDSTVSGLSAISAEIATARVKALLETEAEPGKREKAEQAVAVRDKYFGGKFKVYAVKRGDDLQKIADNLMRSSDARIGGTDAYAVRERIVKAIKVVNELDDAGHIRAGQSLLIPSELKLKGRVQDFVDQTASDVLDYLKK